MGFLLPVVRRLLPDDGGVNVAPLGHGVSPHACARAVGTGAWGSCYQSCGGRCQRAVAAR